MRSNKLQNKLNVWAAKFRPKKASQRTVYVQPKNGVYQQPKTIKTRN